VSEYQWWVKQIWFGVEGPKPDLPMLGIIKRSGMVRQCGHFCHVKIPVDGRKVWAGGAEDRIFGMHYVKWADLYQNLPKGIIPAVGWAKGGNNYVFLHEGKLVLACGRGELEPLPEDLWLDEWKKEVPLTLLQRGADLINPQPGSLMNHYVAMLKEPELAPRVWGKSRPERPVVTLPVKCFDKEKGEFVGSEGATSLWNGPPPPWCLQVVEVKSTHSFACSMEDEVTVLWRRHEQDA
jgi:hypothetical protein